MFNSLHNKLSMSHLLPVPVLTDDGDWLPGESDSSRQSHVLTPTTCGPEADHVLQTKKHHQDNLLQTAGKTSLNRYKLTSVLLTQYHVSFIENS